MKEIKKITSLVLAGSMVLAFCACAPKDQPETQVSDTTEKPTESITETTSEEGSDVEATGNRWVDQAHCYINGHEIVFDQSTIQDLYDTGCHIVIENHGNMISEDEAKTYTLDTKVSMSETISILLFPDEASASSGKGKIYAYYFFLPQDQELTLGECLVRGITASVDEASAWGDKLKFDFPLTMNTDQLKENSGEPDFDIEKDNEYSYIVNPNGIFRQSWKFTFDENNEFTEFRFTG